MALNPIEKGGELVDRIFLEIGRKRHGWAFFWPNLSRVDCTLLLHSVKVGSIMAVRMIPLPNEKSK